MIRNAPIPRVVRTATQLIAARQALGLDIDGLAEMVEIAGPSEIRDWESGAEPVPRPITQLLEFCMNLLMQREEIEERLESLMSGERLCGGLVCGNAANDISNAEIANALMAKAMSDIALAKITRQPVPDFDSLMRREQHPR